MTTIAQSTLQPEALGVIAVLAVAVVSLAVVAVALVRSRRARAAREARLRADAPRPERFDDRAAADVVTIADKALYERDARDVTDAALWLHAQGHAQALPYLLHALRLAPPHHRERLLDAAAGHHPDELADHPLLAAAIEPRLLAALRDAVQARQEPAAEPARARFRRR